MKRFPLGIGKEPQNTVKGKHEGILLQYKDLLYRYQQMLERYLKKLPSVDEHAMGGQMSALQLSQLRDQNERILLLLEEVKNNERELVSEIDSKLLVSGKQTIEQMENLLATNIETNYKLDEFDKKIVSNVTANFVELQKQLLYQLNEKQTHLMENHYNLHKKVKGNRVLLWILLVFQFIGLGVLAFIILYLLEIIYI